MKLTKGGSLARPNVCFICETTPPIDSKVIDTERFYDPGYQTRLGGEKYVCEKCVNQMASFFEFASADRVHIAEHQANQDRLILRGLKWRLDALFEDLRHIAENPGLIMDGDLSVQDKGSASPSGEEGGGSDLDALFREAEGLFAEGAGSDVGEKDFGPEGRHQASPEPDPEPAAKK